MTPQDKAIFELSDKIERLQNQLGAACTRMIRIERKLKIIHNKLKDKK